MRIAAIDVGSNSVRLLVADVQARPDSAFSLVTVARAGEQCRLGRGLGRTGMIDLEMADRAALLVRQFVARARALGTLRIIIAATAAMRSAANGREVAARIGESCGQPVRILSGEDEARLVYRAVIHGLGPRARPSQCVVFDLGGGSTEVVSGVGQRPGRWASLPFGAVSLTERFLHSNPPSDDEIAGARVFVQEELMHLCASMPQTAALLAGVGGTVTVVGALDRELATYEPAMLEGWMVPRDRLDALVRRLLLAGREERISWPVMGEGRADIIGAGALVLGLLVERFGAPGLICSTQGLRYGLARLAAEEAIGVDATPDERGEGLRPPPEASRGESG